MIPHRKTSLAARTTNLREGMPGKLLGYSISGGPGEGRIHNDYQAFLFGRER
jgi:hypothetical protein